MGNNCGSEPCPTTTTTFSPPPPTTTTTPLAATAEDFTDLLYFEILSGVLGVFVFLQIIDLVVCRRRTCSMRREEKVWCWKKRRDDDSLPPMMTLPDDIEATADDGPQLPVPSHSEADEDPSSSSSSMLTCFRVAFAFALIFQATLCLLPIVYAMLIIGWPASVADFFDYILDRPRRLSFVLVNFAFWTVGMGRMLNFSMNSASKAIPRTLFASYAAATLFTLASVILFAFHSVIFPFRIVDTLSTVFYFVSVVLVIDVTGITFAQIIKEHEWRLFRELTYLRGYIFSRWSNDWLRVIACVGGCVSLWLGARAATIMVPRYTKWIVDESVVVGLRSALWHSVVKHLPFTNPESYFAGTKHFSPVLIIIGVSLMMLKSGEAFGINDAIFSFLWLFIEQHMVIKLEIKSFHSFFTMKLNEWPSAKKIGELAQIMLIQRVDKKIQKHGSHSIHDLLGSISSFVSALVDIVIVFIALLSFDAAFSVHVVITSVLYLFATYYLLKIHLHYWREYKRMCYESAGFVHESLVRYREIRESDAVAVIVSEYTDAQHKVHSAEKHMKTSKLLLILCQNLISACSFICFLMLAAWMYVDPNVSAKGLLSPGDFVQFIAYMLLVYRPLNNIANSYTTFMCVLTDVQRMREEIGPENDESEASAVAQQLPNDV